MSAIPAPSGTSDAQKKVKHTVMSDTDSSADSDRLKRSWVDSFLDQPKGDWFCHVPNVYSGDNFNTYGISVDSSHFKTAYQQLLGSGDESSESFDSDSEDEIEKCTEIIFGMIHSRYIFSPEGLAEMYKKYQDGTFGYCPRFNCKQQKMLPIGLSDRPGVSPVKLYCPNCKQVYEPDARHAGIDGSFFGRSFAHYLILEAPRLKKQEDQSANMAQMDQSMLTSESQSNKVIREI